MAITKPWAYRNTLLLLLSFVAVFFVSQTSTAHALLQFLGQFGYVGGAVAGFFFVSTFTVAPSAVLLFHLAEELNPVLLALSAGAGGVLGDLILFKILKDRVYAELAPLAERLGGSNLRLIMHSPYFAWFAPVLGALIIASPFPDEAGISLLGLSKIKTLHFMALTFLLNTLGIFAVILLAQGIG